MFHNKINQYLRNKNKMLEQSVHEYESDAKRNKDLMVRLSSLESEWNSEIDKLKERQAEYDQLIKEVKVLRYELLRAKKRREVSQ